MSQGTYRTRIITEYRTPDEALRITEDIMSMDLAIQFLMSVDDFTTFGLGSLEKKELWLIIQKIKVLKQSALHKLRHEYLMPKKRLNGRREQASNKA